MIKNKNRYITLCWIALFVLLVLLGYVKYVGINKLEINGSFGMLLGLEFWVCFISVWLLKDDNMKLFFTNVWDDIVLTLAVAIIVLDIVFKFFLDGKISWTLVGCFVIVVVGFGIWRCSDYNDILVKSEQYDFKKLTDTKNKNKKRIKIMQANLWESVASFNQLENEDKKEKIDIINAYNDITMNSKWDTCKNLFFASVIFFSNEFLNRLVAGSGHGPDWVKDLVNTIIVTLVALAIEKNLEFYSPNNSLNQFMREEGNQLTNQSQDGEVLDEVD